MGLIPSRRKNRRTPIVAAVAGIAVGSVVAYWLRPGRKETPEQRRRREQLKGAIERSPLIDELTPAPEGLDDDLILELIRSELRRCCSYSGAVTLTCDAGVVHLAGPILKSELNRVLRSVSRTPGVEEVHDHLEAHRHPWSFGEAGETSEARYLKVSR
jgi:hypothetical protein